MRTLTKKEQAIVEDIILSKHLKITETVGFNYINDNSCIVDGKARIFIQILLCDASEDLGLRIKTEIPHAQLEMKQHHCNVLALLAICFDTDGQLTRDEFVCV